MSEPVLGFLYFGGPLSGALIRDIRLANELASRGFRVHVWWMMDRPDRSPMHAGVTEHFLCNGMRYLPVQWGLRVPRGVMDRVGRLFSWWLSERKRARSLQKRPYLLDRMISGFMTDVCDGVERDRPVIRRFSRELDAAGVTHMMPMLSVLAPWVMAARRLMTKPLKYFVTFQGYELYLHYATRVGRQRELIARLREGVEQSDWPCVAVSADYARRVHEDIGIPLESIGVIPPGVPLEPSCERSRARGLLHSALAQWDDRLPLVTYLGRLDNEKGIDLLLMAAALLRRRGEKFQLAICGPTLFGSQYADICRRIADNLGQPVLWRNQVSDEVRSALFFESRCVVYPSIHREPFGMVPVEAEAHGTPAVVPDLGGVADTIRGNGKTAGLRFRAWDSGDLADQIATLLRDDALWQEYSKNGPEVAEYYSCPRMADRVLSHLGLMTGRSEVAVSSIEQSSRTEVLAELAAARRH